MRFFSYKITHDTGFAPNPFGQTLTLATCKPEIRRCKKVGDWIAGFTSKKLNGDPVGEERLVFLMRVGEKLLIRDYFTDSRFQDKIPDMNAKGALVKAGDNIYRPLLDYAHQPEHFEQLPNANHWDTTANQSLLGLRQSDIAGQFVLIADEFYYFGVDALPIPHQYRPKVPSGQAAHGWGTAMPRASEFIQYMRSEYAQGRHGVPNRWENGGEASCGGCG